MRHRTRGDSGQNRKRAILIGTSIAVLIALLLTQIRGQYVGATDIAKPGATPLSALHLPWGSTSLQAKNGAGDVWYSVLLGPRHEEPILKLGDKGSEVKQLQVDLSQAGEPRATSDGDFTNDTQESVKSFQKESGLPVTGVVDAATWSQLNRTIAWVNQPTLTAASSGPAVVALASDLAAFGYSIASPSQTYSANMQRAVEDYQRNHQLPITGTVDAETWLSIYEALLIGRDPIVSNGSSGSQVVDLQNELRANGVPVPVTGIFDDILVQALKKYQTAHGLSATGTYDANTYQYLNRPMLFLQLRGAQCSAVLYNSSLHPVASTTGGTLKYSAPQTGLYYVKVHVGNAAHSSVMANDAIGSRLLIYYGALSTVNESSSLAQASGALSKFDYFVTGVDFDHPDIDQMTTDAQIFSQIHADNPNEQIYGYVDLGVSTSDYSLSQLKTMIDTWLAMGADGVFLDDAGYDFKVSRLRLNSMVDYAHQLGLSAFVNAWHASDVFSPRADATMNPAGAKSHLGFHDIYLLESSFVDTDDYARSGGYASISAFASRAKEATQFRNQLGTKIMASNTVDYSLYSTSAVQNFFRNAEAAAGVYSLDGYGLMAHNYASTGPDADKVFIPNFLSSYMKYYSKAPIVRADGDSLAASADGFSIRAKGAQHSYTIPH